MGDNLRAGKAVRLLFDCRSTRFRLDFDSTAFDCLSRAINNNNNNRISIAPYGRNFRGAGGRSDQCSVKA